MTLDSLDTLAQAMVMSEKGILAADESTGTIKKRLDSVGVESTAEVRRTYRELLFGALGANKYISGIILFDETLRQKSAAGQPFPDMLAEQDIIPGIKVDKSTHPLAGASEYPITEGLDGLRARCEEYLSLGAKFTKWRAVIKIIDSHTPELAIQANAHALARFAAISQEAGLVPIVEPEVLMDGGHSIDVCQSITERTLKAVFDELCSNNVRLEAIVLKPNMVVPGSDASRQADTKEIAARTIEVLNRYVPPAVPGIAFLSGGQSERDATNNLNALNQKGPHAWELTFSYGRALQQSALHAWSGEEKKIKAGQTAYLHRARMNSLAHAGHYKLELEKE